MARGKNKTKASSGGASRFVLLVGDEGAILVQMQKKRVLRRLFAQSPDPAHVRSLEDALNSAPNAPITMIVDMMDQSYVRQTLPPVSSLSVGKIVRRRLDKDFSRDDIKGYLILDREKTGRRDWNYLMVSLANPPLLQKWIAFAVERSNPFNGLGLTPLESQSFMTAVARSFLPDKKAEPREWQILVSHNKVGGFRQVITRGGKLVFTRMAQPIGESNPEVIAGNIEQEIINTQEYLKRMGLQDNQSLAVTVLASEEIKAVLDPKNVKAGEYHFFTPFEMATLLALPDAAQPEDHFGDVVISAFVGRKRKLTLPLQTPYTGRLKKLALYIMGLRGAAALCAIGIFGWVGMMAYDIYSTRSETEDIIAQQKPLRSQLSAIKVEARTLPKQIDAYTDVMALSKAFDKQNIDALAFIGNVAGTMADAALVKDYHWTVADPLAITSSGDKRQVDAEIEIQLTTAKQPQGPYIAAAQSLMDRFTKAFPLYDFTHTELPGLLSDTKELKTVLDDNGNATPQNEGATNDDTVKLSLKGPKPPKDSGQGMAGTNGH